MSSLTALLHLRRPHSAPPTASVKMLLLLSCWILAGVAAEDIVQTHYQMKDSSACLNVTKPRSYKGEHWSFGRKFIVSKDEINPEFAGKVTFDPSSLILCIKALNENNTGNYTMSYRDDNFNRYSQRHNVIVQDAVPRPVVQMTVLRSNLSAGFCRIQVNCSVRDDWVAATCGADSCEVSERSSRQVTVDLVSISNWTVVCSGRNRVSAKNVSTNVSTSCFSAPAPGHTETTAPPILTLAIVSAVCLSVLVLIAFTAGRKRQPLVEPRPRPQPRLSTSSSASQPAYENVDASCPVGEPGSSPVQEADTVYSMAQAPCGTPSPLGGASPSPSVPVRGGGPTEVNTLYSVLYKVKPQHH